LNDVAIEDLSVTEAKSIGKEGWMKRALILVFLSVSVIGFGTSVFALQISQIEFDLHLPPGAGDMYTLKVINNKSDPQDISVYLGDWTRTDSGENDFLTLNSGRWLFAREFQPGDELNIVYRVSLPHEGISVTGSYASAMPSAQGVIAGPEKLVLGTQQDPVGATDGPVSITRTVLSTDGKAITVNLNVKVLQGLAGLRIDEVFSLHVDITSVDSVGSEFSTVNRSCGDWISVSPQSFRIEPGEARSVSFRVDVPDDSLSGMYWAMIFVQGAPRPEQREGATILAIERFGVKIYQTIPGTSVLSGEVRRVRQVDDDPLTFEVLFANTGNVQLGPTGTISVINLNGDVVRSLAIDEFRVLPDKERILTVVDDSTSSLPDGIYRGLVTIDYGGDSLAGGTRDFKLR
jgi:hypothetical protein